MGCVSTPQTRDRGAARAHLMAGAMHGPIGSGGAMIWWRRWPIHGGRGPKPLEGRAAAAHVDCCVLWLCGCVVVIFFPSLTQELMQNCSPRAALTNQHTIRVHQRISTLGWQLGLAFVLWGENIVSTLGTVYLDTRFF
jgi:hypothetical protein